MDLKQVIEELKEKGHRHTATKDGLARHLLTTSQRVEFLADELGMESNRKLVAQRDVSRLEGQLKEKQETIDALLMCIRDLHQKDRNTYRFDVRYALNQAGCDEKAGCDAKAP